MVRLKVNLLYIEIYHKSALSSLILLLVVGVAAFSLLLTFLSLLNFTSEMNRAM